MALGVLNKYFFVVLATQVLLSIINSLFTLPDTGSVTAIFGFFGAHRNSRYSLVAVCSQISLYNTINHSINHLYHTLKFWSWPFTLLLWKSILFQVHPFRICFFRYWYCSNSLMGQLYTKQNVTILQCIGVCFIWIWSILALFYLEDQIRTDQIIFAISSNFYIMMLCFGIAVKIVGSLFAFFIQKSLALPRMGGTRESA